MIRLTTLSIKDGKLFKDPVYIIPGQEPMVMWFGKMEDSEGVYKTTVLAGFYCRC